MRHLRSVFNLYISCFFSYLFLCVGFLLVQESEITTSTPNFVPKTDNSKLLNDSNFNRKPHTLIKDNRTCVLCLLKSEFYFMNKATHTLR